jgi:hypothetical protein
LKKHILEPSPYLSLTTSAHGAFASNALNARAMNAKPGGKQPRMRDTVFNGQVQHMVFPEDYHDPELHGKPKGMHKILEECNLWKDGMVRKCNSSTPAGEDCCMLHMLEQQEALKTRNVCCKR